MLLTVLFCLYSLVASALTLEEQSGPLWQRDIQSILDTQVTAWNRGDVAGYMEGYWKSDSLTFTSSGKIQRGWVATLETYKKSYDTKDKMGALTFSKLEFTLMSPESAWILGQWELERVGDHPHGVFTLILRKFPEGWEIIHDHTSETR